MHPSRIAAALCAAAPIRVAASPGPVLAAPQCAPRAEIVAALQERYREATIGVGLAANGASSR
jgi:hypothetical protein